METRSPAKSDLGDFYNDSRILTGHKRYLIKEETELRNYEKYGHQNRKIPVVSIA